MDRPAGTSEQGAQALERRFVETNYRRLEVDQAFSLSQVAPAALVALREGASCSFDLPELFFDLAYPGQYRRQIKAVRVTIPCVTGPFTNVGATLTLTGSRIRKTPALAAAELTEVPPRRSVSIASSTAQHDSGVFEFSFRDERYMPFEGAGAISSWKLALPDSFRPFDYRTISDVVLHVSYTADQDGTLREKVEKVTNIAEGAILKVLQTAGLARTFSLRQDFSGALNRLLHSPVNTPVTVAITPNHLPLFLGGRTPAVTKAKLVVRTSTATLTGLTISVGGTDFSSFQKDDTLGKLRSTDVTAAFAAGLIGEHKIIVTAAGNQAPSPPVPGDQSAIDAAKVDDVMLYVEYKL